jgi:hypothetical protein
MIIEYTLYSIAYIISWCVFACECMCMYVHACVHERVCVHINIPNIYITATNSIIVGLRAYYVKADISK